MSIEEIYEVKLSLAVIEELKSQKFSLRQTANISGWIRENQGCKILSYDIERLHSIRAPAFHERANKILLMLEKMTSYAGEYIKKDDSWIAHSWCTGDMELREVLKFITDQKWIIGSTDFGDESVKIIPNGWARLEELKKSSPNSNQCFVAMWFTDEMNQIFEDYLKPAIEYIEPGAKGSRFKAIKIDNVEHTNDINDEIIAQIRRSRFMVCDLTGYRGGVYFEAGFAYGLGLDVIYTCRKDWTKEDILKDSNGDEITTLLDSNKNPVTVKKEGVHFDLAHRNRIEWESTHEGLKDFKTKLENRIKAVIV